MRRSWSFSRWKKYIVRTPEQRRNSGVSDRKGLENTEKVGDGVCGGEACGEGLKKAEHACKKIQAYKHYSNGCRNALQETICRATVMISYNRSRQSPALPPFA